MAVQLCFWRVCGPEIHQMLTVINGYYSAKFKICHIPIVIAIYVCDVLSS